MAKSYINKGKGSSSAFKTGDTRKFYKSAKTTRAKVEDILAKGGELKNKYKITDADLAAMWKSRADMGALKRVLSPIGKRMQSEVMEEVRNEILQKRPKLMPWIAVGLAFLNRGNIPLDRSDPKSDPIAMEQYTCPAIARIAGGQTIPHRIRIDPGPPNTMMSVSMDEYGTKSYNELHTSGYRFNLDMSYSQAGINRKGVYAPWVNTLTGDNYGIGEVDLAYDQLGTVTMGMLRNFIYGHAMSNAILNYMDGANTGNMDLLFPIVSTTSIHRIRNRMEYTPIDITIYLLRSRVRTGVHPAGAIFLDWTNAGPTESNDYCPIDAPDGEKYVFPTEQTILTQVDPSDNTTNQAINRETSVQLGITPQWSSMFNRRWEVCEVLKERLQPDDIYELHFDRSYKYPHSFRSMASYFGSGDEGDLEALNNYVPGDYELLITFNGVPGTCAGNIPGTTLNVDSLKSRISKTVEHKLRYSWRTTAPNDPTNPTSPADLLADGWITSSTKNTNTERRTASFDAGYNAIVTSAQDRETGGGI